MPELAAVGDGGHGKGAATKSAPPTPVKKDAGAWKPKRQHRRKS